MGTVDFGVLVKEFCDSRGIPVSEEDAATLGLWFKVALPSYLERSAESTARRAAENADLREEAQRARAEASELRGERDQLLRDVDGLTDRLAASVPCPPLPNAPTPRRGRAITEHHLQYVSEVAISALRRGASPAAMVATQTGSSKATAYRWMKQAREAGYLYSPPSKANA